MDVYMKAWNGEFEAYGWYENGKVTVYKGSRIRMASPDNFRKTLSVVVCRGDSSCVDENGSVLKDCVFKSPSTAAQFVSGRSTNGYLAWHVAKRMSLKSWLQNEKEK